MGERKPVAFECIMVDQKSNILHVIARRSNELLPRFFLPLCLKLQAQGTENEVAVLESRVEERVMKGLSVTSLPTTTFVKDVRALRKRIRSSRARIVQAHSRAAFFICLCAARLEGAVFMYSAHRKEDVSLTGFWLKRAGALTVSRQAFLDQWTQKGLAAEKIHLVKDGLDLEYVDYQRKAQSREDVRAQLSLDPQTFVIGNFGALIKEEDHLTLLKCFRKLLKKKLNAELVLLGQGPMKKDLESFLKEHDLQDRVHFLDEWDNVYTFIQACDCMVFTTFGYDRSRAVLTASAMGRPVIATKIGRHEEVILDPQTGALVPCGFPERIDSAIMRLKAIPTLAAETGAKGRAFVEEQYSLESMCRGYQKVYAKFIKTERLAAV